MSMASLKRLGRTLTATISSGDYVSGAVDIRTVDVFGFLFPAMTSTGVTFQVSISSGGTYVDLYMGSSQVNLATSTSAARAVVLDLDRPALSPWQWVKLVSSATEQAGRSITVCAK